MKNKLLCLLVIVLTGCSKKNDAPVIAPYTYVDDPPPPYSMLLSVDFTQDRTYSSQQVSFNIAEYNNTDYSTKDKRPNAHTVTITAADSTSSFTLYLKMVDLVPGDYWLDSKARTYVYTDFVFTVSLDYITESYYGYAMYRDSSGSYLADADVLFHKLDFGHIQGYFNTTSMTNTVTHEKRYISGDFYY